MVIPGRLREPHVARVSGQLTALARGGHVLAHVELAARGVDDKRAALPAAEHVRVECVLRPRVKRAVERRHVAVLPHLLYGREIPVAVVCRVALPLGRLGLQVPVHVAQVHVERVQAALHGSPMRPGAAVPMVTRSAS